MKMLFGRKRNVLVYIMLGFISLHIMFIRESWPRWEYFCGIRIFMKFYNGSHWDGRAGKLRRAFLDRNIRMKWIEVKFWEIISKIFC